MNKDLINDADHLGERIYKIVGFKYNFNNTGKLAVNVQINNSSRKFFCLVEDMYKLEWVNYLSKEDCVYLATLYVSEKENKPEIVSYFPRKHVNVTINVLLLSVLYTAFFILSNIAGSKIVDFGFVTIPAVLVFFPITYILDDIITEVYGFKVSRTIIWTALIANLLVIAGAILVVKMQHSAYWSNQDAFEKVFLASPRIFTASVLAYLFGEFINSASLAKLKVHTKGKYLWFRSILSTSIGSIFDSILFCFIAFYGSLPSSVIFIMIITQYLFKISYAVLALPVVYKVTAFLKKTDKVDVYDFSTRFNPFSL